MSFWTTLEADLNKGLEVASVIVGAFAPSWSGVLTDIAEVLGDVETVFGTSATSPTPTEAEAKTPTVNLSQIVQSATTVSVLKQHAAVQKAKTAAS